MMLQVVRILRENDNHYRIEDTGELLYEYESRLLKAYTIFVQLNVY